MDKFLVFLGFLFGEPGRSFLGDVEDGGIDKRSGESMEEACELDVKLLKVLRAESGGKELGDSGEELGEGSVNEESTVEIVVVGDDSVESVLRVFVDARRCSVEGFMEL